MLARHDTNSTDRQYCEYRLDEHRKQQRFRKRRQSMSPVMRLFIKYLVSLFAAIILAGCINSGSVLVDMVSALTIYQGAYDINKHILGSASYQQLSYKIEKHYPLTDVLEYYDQYFTEQA